MLKYRLLLRVNDRTASKRCSLPLEKTVRPVLPK